MSSTQPPPLPPIPRAESAQRYRAVARLGRWPVGTVFSGEALPGRGRCTILFPDIIGPAIEPFVRAMADEVGRNRLLADLPLLGVTHIGLDARQRPFAVLPGGLGPDLATWISERGPLAPLAALQLATEIGDTLSRLHYRTRVLGELSPWMVRLPIVRGEPVRLLDLGLARGLFDLAVQPPKPSPAFAAPRVRAGEALRAGDDLYVLGAILYFALTGEPPPPGAVPRPSERVELGPFADTLDAVVLHALGARTGPHSPTGMMQLTRQIRGARDLLRLSPQARGVVLRVRGPESRAPGAVPADAEPMPPGALGFVEMDGPLFETQADLADLSPYLDEEDAEVLSLTELESLGDDALERIRTGKLPRITR